MEQLHIETIEDQIVIPNLVESYVFWKDAIRYNLIKNPRVKEYNSKIEKRTEMFPLQYPYNAMLKEVDEDICPICGGFGAGKIENMLERPGDQQEIYCICHLQGMVHNITDRLRSYQSKGPYVKTLDDMEYYGTPQQIATLKTALADITKWIVFPTKWMVLCGATGCGKTKMLRHIYTVFSSLSLYITSGDIESHVFNGISNNDLDKRMEVIKQAPILLLDDYGIEYGSDIVRAKIDHIIEYRYRDWNQYKTIVATNLSPQDLASSNMRHGGVSRSGSRLCDSSVSTILGIKMEDYRLKANSEERKVIKFQ
jgi:DNA replication protein DnaC